jgi:cobalt-zinc-cadmium efflux system protein
MTQDKRLAIVLLLNLAMIAGLVLVGLASHSLGVLAAGGDYIGDAAAIGVSIMALRLSRHKHGHPKATSYAALVNAGFLLCVTTIVIIEAIRRLTTRTPHIEGLPVLLVSTVAAVVMIGGAFILGGDKENKDLNMRSVMLDTVADATAAAGVAVAGGIILVTKGHYWLDSAVALIIGLVVGYHALKLLREVFVELRQRSL